MTAGRARTRAQVPHHAPRTGAFASDRPGGYDSPMLKRLLRNVFAACPEPAAQVPPAVDPRPALETRFDAAVEAWRAGRTGEAAAACWSLLAAAPDYWPAHNLLATIELPGENYFRVLERMHAHLKPRTYLEIGVSRGESIRLAGAATRAIGVDPAPAVAHALGPKASIVAATSDDFFARHDVRAELGGLPVDFAFIDGMHHFEFALRDFVNIEALCEPASTIVIHDVYPLDRRTAARERVTAFWSGDIWRLVLLLRRHRPDLVVRTIATAPTGLALVRNLDPRSARLRDRLDALVEEGLALDYGVLESCKAEALALLPNDWGQVRALLDAPPAAGR